MVVLAQISLIFVFLRFNSSWPLTQKLSHRPTCLKGKNNTTVLFRSITYNKGVIISGFFLSF